MTISSHVYRVGDGHDCDGYECWCRPVFIVPCDDCPQPDDIDPESSIALSMSEGRSIRVTDRASCWKCQSGWIELTREQAEEADDVIAVHNP